MKIFERCLWLLLSIGTLVLAAIIYARHVHGETYDPVVQLIEGSYNVHPGDPLPQDWRTPNIRLQYKNTTPLGNGCYQVNICRYR
jgi:hypothetical protein